MKTININQLQAQISRVMKDVEEGESYEVMRYSRPVAIISPKSAQKAEPVARCEECLERIDRVMEILEGRDSEIATPDMARNDR